MSTNDLKVVRLFCPRRKDEKPTKIHNSKFLKSSCMQLISERIFGLFEAKVIYNLFALNFY
jgi:hypothetical protein